MVFDKLLVLKSSEYVVHKMLFESDHYNEHLKILFNMILTV